MNEEKYVRRGPVAGGVLLPAGQSVLPGTGQVMESYNKILGGGKPRTDMERQQKKAWEAYVKMNSQSGLSQAQLKEKFKNDLVADAAWRLDQIPRGQFKQSQSAMKAGGGPPVSPIFGGLSQYMR
jgi:hypothetical protein